jgi:hypothetical protein
MIPNLKQMIALGRNWTKGRRHKMKSKYYEKLMRQRRKIVNNAIDNGIEIDWVAVDKIDILIDEEQKRIDDNMQKFLDSIVPMEAL